MKRKVSDTYGYVKQKSSFNSASLGRKSQCIRIPNVRKSKQIINASSYKNSNLRSLEGGWHRGPYRIGNDGKHDSANGQRNHDRILICFGSLLVMSASKQTFPTRLISFTSSKREASS